MFDIALKIVSKLNSCNFDAYIVGGACRDKLLCKNIHDVDITTNAKPDEILQVFSDYKTLDIGKKHGTISVLFENFWFEITTYRIEGEYLNNRRPKTVEFTDNLYLDLSRRDFTINAICFNHLNGDYIDFFGGIFDLNDKIIRCIGNADERFKEDALRILRAVRFSSELGFTIEEKTKKAIISALPLLNNISKERIYAEFCKILQGKFVQKALTENSEVLFEIIPELKPTKDFDQKSLSHLKGVYDHILEVVSLCDENDLVLRLTALFHDSGKAYCYQDTSDGYRHFYGHWVSSSEIAKTVLTRLKAPKTIISQVSVLCLYHDADLKTKYEIKSFLSKYSEELFEKLLKHKYFDLITHSQHGIDKYGHFYYNTSKLYNEIKSSGECYRFSDMNFNGDDCIRLGIKNSEISKTLNIVFDLILQNVLLNDKEIIENYIKHNLL